MKCEEVRDEMIAYLKDELDEDRKKEVDEHLTRCKGCQQELETSQKILHQTQAANEATVIRVVHTLIQEAIQAGASDIHIDPTRDGIEVRLRIDGMLHPHHFYGWSGDKPVELERLSSPDEREAVTARIKLMAEIPLTVQGVPQDGRIPIRMEDRDYDLRVTTVPVVYGEKITMRILDNNVPLIGLDKLGFLPEQLESVRNMVRQPKGQIVVTGPAGSGRTTTLYSMLLDIRDPAISIMTVEDPVECILKDIHQTQVNSKTGLTFPAALRSFLRQDPDIIMVGETRDQETAEIAVGAAVMGHLVLSTLHTNNAPSAIIRMLDMGLETWLVGSSLIGVIAQRLVRKICPDCREEYIPDNEALEFLGLKDQVGKVKFYRGAGCEKCKVTGSRGRTALFEVLTIDRELGQIISDGNISQDIIFRHAVEKGFVPMAEVARRKVLEGITTAEEMHKMFSLR